MRASRVLRLGVLLTIALAGCGKKAPQFGFTIQDHDLSVTLVPAEHRLDAIDRLTVQFKSKKTIRFLINENLEVRSVRAGGQNCDFHVEREFDPESVLPAPFREDTAWVERAALVTVALPQLDKKANKLEVEYRGVIFDSTAGAEFSHGYMTAQTSGIISVRGVYLAPSSLWYPTVPGELSAVRVSARTPSPYEVVGQGALRRKPLANGWIQTIWDERQPQEGIYLAAGKWRITQLPVGPYSVMTYFNSGSPDVVNLERTYLRACTRYLALYERLLGPYPYAKFAVVENFYPTGYGMPSFTLLGSRVIRLPFITRISLGHEICHNWWGNSVYVRPGSGNWCEGLTTYCADYYYEEQRGEDEAAHYRMGINRDFLSYVTPENDFPLRQFRERTDPASRAIGYGKAAMVFHQLRLLVGDSKFWNALRNVYRDYRFRYAGWDDFQRVFEEFYGEELDWFFRQWLDRTGAPALRIASVRKSQEGDRYRITVAVEQDAEELYRVLVPVRVRTTAGSEETLLDLTSEVDSTVIEVVNKPVLAEVDPAFDVFRRLLPGEFPSALSQVLGEREPVFVLPPLTNDSLAAAYRELAEAIDRSGTGRVVASSGKSELENVSFVLFDNPQQAEIWDDLRQKLPPEVQLSGTSVILNGTEYSLSVPGLVVVLVVPSPYNDAKAAAVIWGGSPEAVRAVASRLTHYGKYSYLVFERGRSIARGEWKVTSSPMSVRL